MRTLLIIFLLILGVSCAKNEAEQADEAIDVALTYLSSDECEKALDVLEEAGYQGENAVYLQVLASAYACKASFNEVSFISDDLGDAFVATSFAAIMKSFSIMSLSDETEVDSANYVAIRTGLNILLDSTDGDPSQVERDTKFKRKGGDIGIQALLLTLANLGKYLNYYGNVDATGVKGQGTNTNSCFLNYTDATAQGIITALQGGACISFVDGHPDLDLSTDAGKRRVCEGLMLVSNLIDILENLDFSNSDDLDVLVDVTTQVSSIKQILVTAGLGTLIDTTSQAECETAMDTAANLDDMQYFFALFFETGLK